MAVSIDRITATDWKQLRDIRLRSLQDAPEAFGQRYEEAIETTDDEWQSIARSSASGDRRIWLFARDNSGSPVGVVQGRRRPPSDCLLFSMWVDPSVRKAGIGRRLVDGIQQWGESWGAERVVLWVLAANEPAMRFYDRIDFKVMDSGPDADSGVTYGALAMERRTADYSP